MEEMLHALLACEQFRWFAGRSILDFKVEGGRSLVLSSPLDVLNPLVETMIEIVERTLKEGEDLALLQLIINAYQDGNNSVRPHRHRCRQLCASLGAPRACEVEGRALRMRHGDVLPLFAEEHAVPPMATACGPRVSVCLFYGSVEEYRDRSISVNAIDGWFGESFWWNHPEDLTGRGRGAKSHPNTGGGRRRGGRRRGA